MLFVVLATVYSHVPEAPAENRVGGRSQISIDSLMWNVPNPQGAVCVCVWGGEQEHRRKVCLHASVYLRQHCGKKKKKKHQDDVVSLCK